MRIFRSKYSLAIFALHIYIVSAFSITAEFSYSKRSNCAPVVVEFTNNSTAGAGITYTWDFGLGAVISSSDNLKKIQLYTNAGEYKVTLVVSDGVNADSTSATITIAQGPGANFTASPVIGCPPLLVSYTSTSKKGDAEIVNTAWDFRNGDYGNGASIQYSYDNPGKYNIVLKVTDNNGCFSLIESDSLIYVVKKPTVDFMATDTFACAPPLKVTFVNLSSGSSDLTYKWDYGNGKTSTTINNSSVYDSIGNYDVKLTATDAYGCTDSLVKESYIIIGNPKGSLSVYDINNNIISNSKLCKGNYKFVFSVNNLPDYTWIIHDNGKTSTYTGNNSILYSVKDSGTLDVLLIYGKNSYCTDSVRKTFTKSYVEANFAFDTSIFCAVPQKIDLQNLSNNADTYSWSFSGKFFSNSKDASYTITQEDMPDKTYQQLYSHEINSIHLPFGLIVSNSDGCTDSIIKDATIMMPVARFMPDKVSGCIPLQVTFSDSSKSSFTIDKYIFKIGTDSVTSLYKTPVKYTFSKPGEYLISEIIKSENCYDTSYAVKIIAGEKLIPDFTISPAEVCNGGEIHLVGKSNNNPVVDSWQFKSANIFDLQFSTNPDTVISVYSDSTGYKNVSLLLDYNGCLSDTTKNAAFKIVGPAGSFSESFECDSPLIYNFRSQMAPFTSLIWNIDTATYYNVDSVEYKFPVSGDYTVKLSATDNSSNCTLTRTKLIEVRQVKADFSLTDTIFCFGDTTQLDASSSIDYINNCYNEGFLWDFGDDSSPKRTSSSSYYHIYSEKGTDTILLITRADNGCLDSIEKVIHVFRPQGSFTTDKNSGCVPELIVKFTNTSVDSTIVKYLWNFGDGTVEGSGLKDILHTYSSDITKTYYPSLTVYDTYECRSRYSVPINLIGINSDFQADDNAICVGQTVTFMPVDADLDSLFWSFGDGNISGNNNIHTYYNRGLYSVSLAALKNGCRDTITKQNYINVEEADANFTISDSILNCYPDTLYAVHNNSNGSPVVNRLWTFDSQVLTNNSSSVKYIYTKPGNYTAGLTVITLNNCQASRSVNILITGPTALTSFNPQQICYNDSVTFQIDSLNDVKEWQWLFGDGNTSTSNPVTHRYTSRGHIVPSIILINDNCSVSIALDTLAISSVKANFSSADSSFNICYGNKLDLINSSMYSTYWNWEIDDILTSTDYNLTDVLFPATGEYKVKLIAIDTNNCTDTIIKKFTVIPYPFFFIAGDSVMCLGMDSIVLTVNEDSGWKITWSPAEGVSDPQSFTTIVLPTETTTYRAQVTDTFGCSATREKTIVINQPFNFSRSPVSDTTIYIGESIQLLIEADSDDVSYSWTPNENISCLNCNNPIVNPTSNVTYKVEITNNCFDFTESFTIEVITDFYLEAPTAFSPNGDLNNDVFLFESKNIENFDLKIFNRWGEIVFSSNDINSGWDGKVNDHAQNIDTYTYFIKAETIHGYKFEKKGSFLLLK